MIYIFADISAYPDSVNVLENITSDVRTPDKLIDGLNDTTDGGHMWLAPILPSIVSSLCYIKSIMFDFSDFLLHNARCITVCIKDLIK